MRLIDADSLLKDLNHDIKALDEYLGFSGAAAETLKTLKTIVKKRPSIDYTPVIHAHWVNDGPKLEGKSDWCHCSNCGLEEVKILAPYYLYCYNCGAKMDEELQNNKED